MSVCSACGQENPPIARFCLACGQSLADEGEAPREERRLVSVIFVDLVGFTSRSERLDPEDVQALLRPYHDAVRDEIESFGGVVEKFIGDAIMGLFGAPTASAMTRSVPCVRLSPCVSGCARWTSRAAARPEDSRAVNTGEALVVMNARRRSARRWSPVTS